MAEPVFLDEAIEEVVDDVAHYELVAPPALHCGYFGESGSEKQPD